MLVNDNVVLTPKECAEQFRMYAGAHHCNSSKHQLTFCADFLDEFCTAKVIDSEFISVLKTKLYSLLQEYGVHNQDECRAKVDALVSELLV